MASDILHAIDFAKLKQVEIPSVCVFFGQESFFQQASLDNLCQQVFHDDKEVPFTRFEGKTCQWRDVIDEVGTMSLFGGGNKRLVVVTDADDFVSKHRDALERYFDKPKRSGILVLQVQCWPKTTKLYKKLEKTGLQINCNPPEKKSGKRSVLDTTAILQWMITRAKEIHQVQLQQNAAQMILDLIGAEFGLIDQELARLALMVELQGTVNDVLVRETVGGWQMKAIWDLVDSAVAGQTQAALEHLDQLCQLGEKPQKIYGQLAWSLRRYAAATRIYERAQRIGDRLTLRDALKQAGFPNWPKALDEAQARLKKLGRIRASKLYQQLLEIDLALKGTHSHETRGRLLLENLIVSFASELDPRILSSNAS